MRQWDNVNQVISDIRFSSAEGAKIRGVFCTTNPVGIENDGNRDWLVFRQVFRSCFVCLCVLAVHFVSSGRARCTARAARTCSATSTSSRSAGTAAARPPPPWTVCWSWRSNCRISRCGISCPASAARSRPPNRSPGSAQRPEASPGGECAAFASVRLVPRSPTGPQRGAVSNRVKYRLGTAFTQPKRLQAIYSA